MNMSPFYVLRERLYSCAAAGCMTVNEDFRLKRAVEEFSPLAEANKVFGKLYAMCQRLFTEESPAPLLAECIALADAVAVTQGSFSETEETEESAFSVEVSCPENVPYSALNALAGKITSAGPMLERLSAEETELLRDPRILALFIRLSDTNSIFFGTLAENMSAIYGKSLIEPLKRSLDLSDEKASGKQIEYVSQIAGYEENDWYLSLAENENAPAAVRIKAISALGCDIRNSEKLLSLYRTEKGKIKNAALTEIARLDPPEAEEIIRNMTEKYKQSYEQYISISPSKAAVDFVRERIKACETDAANNTTNYLPEQMIGLLYNKSEADDCFMSALGLLSGDKANIYDENSYYTTKVRGQANNVLISNLKNSPNDKYKALISRLYAADNRIFFPAFFFMKLTEEPQDTFENYKNEINANRRAALGTINNISYSHAENRYVITYKTDTVKIRLPLFEKMPQSAIDFVGDTSELEKKGSLLGKLVSAVKKGSGEGSVTDTDHACHTFTNMLLVCAPEDSERIKAAAVRLALSAAKNAPCSQALKIISQYYTDGRPEEYYGLATRYVMRQITECGRAVYMDFMKELPMTSEQKLAELSDLLKTVKTASIPFTNSETVRNSQLSYINIEINRINLSKG